MKKYILCLAIRKTWKQKCRGDRLSSAFSHFWDLTASKWSCIIIKVGILCLLGMWYTSAGAIIRKKKTWAPLHLVLSFLVSLMNVICFAKSEFNCDMMKSFMVLPSGLRPDLTSIPVYRRYCIKYVLKTKSLRKFTFGCLDLLSRLTDYLSLSVHQLGTQVKQSPF